MTWMPGTSRPELNDMQGEQHAYVASQVIGAGLGHAFLKGIVSL